MTVNHDVAGSSPAGGANEKQTAKAVCFFFLSYWISPPIRPHEVAGVRSLATLQRACERSLRFKSNFDNRCAFFGSFCSSSISDIMFTTHAPFLDWDMQSRYYDREKQLNVVFWLESAKIRGIVSRVYASFCSATSLLRKHCGLCVLMLTYF